MKKVFALLMLILTGCSAKKKSISLDSDRICNRDFVLNHTVNLVGCSSPEIYSDPKMPVLYGVCEDSGQPFITSVIMPTLLYHQVARSVENDGGKVICIDNDFTIIQPYLR